MKGERKLLWVSIGFAVTGWLIVGTFAVDRDDLKQKVASVEQDAANWKKQAGKAYTELLKARSGSDSQRVSIPSGARIECQMKKNLDGNTVAQCEDGLVYPPEEY
ncbi:hypothetical protein C9426_24055 [Serratia sp. S1B]|nr:hypothetical protein C9426_24055 [Serratia sp. S1B]